MFNRFDIIEAYYLFGQDYHSGQFSKEYAYIGRALNTGWKPGPNFTFNSLSDNGKDIYNNLVSHQGLLKMLNATDKVLYNGDSDKNRRLFKGLIGEVHSRGPSGKVNVTFRVFDKKADEYIEHRLFANESIFAKVNSLASHLSKDLNN